MNILALGDSFAESDVLGTWINYLRDHGHTVNHYGVAGVSQFYIYKKLLEPKLQDLDHYDRVIVLCTSPGRLYHDDEHQFASYPHAESFIKSCKVQDEKYYMAISHSYYYRYIASDIYNNFIYNAVINEIARVVPAEKLILYPAFPVSEVAGIVSADAMPLVDIWGHQNDLIYKAIESMSENNQVLKNHLLPENQMMVADCLHQWITTGFVKTISWRSVKQIAPAEISKYFNR